MRAMNDSNLNTTTLYRNGVLVLLLMTIALIVHNIFGENGYLALRRQQKELHTLQQKVQQLKQENEQLGRENQSLKSDPAAIERLAREQMHLAKRGEKVYTRSDQAPANPPPAPGKENSPQP
ncbi:MAG: septum formation initiator family protein [Terriglobia bacterium]